jgi:hypothetical protein
MGATLFLPTYGFTGMDIKERKGVLPERLDYTIVGY